MTPSDMSDSSEDEECPSQGSSNLCQRFRADDDVYADADDDDDDVDDVDGWAGGGGCGRPSTMMKMQMGMIMTRSWNQVSYQRRLRL